MTSHPPSVALDRRRQASLSSPVIAETFVPLTADSVTDQMIGAVLQAADEEPDVYTTCVRALRPIRSRPTDGDVHHGERYYRRLCRGAVAREINRRAARWQAYQEPRDRLYARLVGLVAHDASESQEDREFVNDDATVDGEGYDEDLGEELDDDPDTLDSHRGGPRRTMQKLWASTAPVCWWCDRPIDRHGNLTIQARNGCLLLHARCVSPMLRDAKVADHYAAGILTLDLDEI
jgi:hypothetical protein